MTDDELRQKALRLLDLTHGVQELIDRKIAELEAESRRVILLGVLTALLVILTVLESL